MKRGNKEKSVNTRLFIVNKSEIHHFYRILLHHHSFLSHGTESIRIIIIERSIE